MNSLKIFDQTFTSEKNFNFLIFFELLDCSEFKKLLPNENGILRKMFEENLDLKYFKNLDLNNVITAENKQIFIEIFEKIRRNSTYLKSNNLNEMISSEALKKYDLKIVGKITYKELNNKFNSDELFIKILNCLNFETFYEVSNIELDELKGKWYSIFETGQLRINYNMTDWFPTGTRIELKIEEFNSEFYRFICLTEITNFITREQNSISVYETKIKIINGFLYHYNNSSYEFLYKKPIYEFQNNTFKTQIDECDFTFQKA